MNACEKKNRSLNVNVVGMMKCRNLKKSFDRKVWTFHLKNLWFFVFFFFVYFLCSSGFLRLRVVAHLKFKAPLTAHLQPQVQTVDVDKDAQFQCIVSGHPVYEINWLHDGKPIIRDNRIEVSSAIVWQCECCCFTVWMAFFSHFFRFPFHSLIINFLQHFENA